MKTAAKRTVIIVRNKRKLYINKQYIYSRQKRYKTNVYDSDELEI